MSWFLCHKEGLSLVNEQGFEEQFFEGGPFDLLAMSKRAGSLVINLKADRPKVRPIPMKKTVLLERGHGPNPVKWEPGATAHGQEEYTLNGIAVEAARTYLLKAGIPCDITDSGSALHEIGKLAQDYEVFVSVHHNSFNGVAQGVECLYHNTLGDPADKELADLIAKSLASATGFSNRGAKPQALGVLSGAETTNVKASVLAECYFMDSLLNNHAEYSTKAGTAIGQAIESWLKKSNVTKPVPTKPTERICKVTKTGLAYTNAGSWNGLQQIKVQLGNKVFNCVSGQKNNQVFLKGGQGTAGTGEPCEQGVYNLSDINWEAGKDNYQGNWGDGLGAWVIDMYPKFKTARSAILFHADSNESTRPGTMGCIGVHPRDQVEFIKAWREVNPEFVDVSWGL